jgi:hypothetical protein
MAFKQQRKAMKDKLIITTFGGPTQNWAPIALADGRLLIRDQSRLICVKVAQ